MGQHAYMSTSGVPRKFKHQTLQPLLGGCCPRRLRTEQVDQVKGLPVAYSAHCARVRCELPMLNHTGHQTTASGGMASSGGCCNRMLTDTTLPSFNAYATSWLLTSCSSKGLNCRATCQACPSNKLLSLRRQSKSPKQARTSGRKWMIRNDSDVWMIWSLGSLSKLTEQEQKGVFESMVGCGHTMAY